LVMEESQYFAGECMICYKTEQKTKQFTIVGIGASAGEFESFSELIARVPDGTGIAYIFVQHLDPGHGKQDHFRFNLAPFEQTGD
jgi:chemotaxis response regulator CheB